MPFRFPPGRRLPRRFHSICETSGSRQQDYPLRAAQVPASLAHHRLFVGRLRADHAAR
ncbi:hypothetical protein C7S16_0092 [Burkholderia thailandensis]|uniref:Uncharacterized protein n=1 Tax=Burkholderia thailandensis TaxID=57975 RepID=A0AAW9D6R7_BURTH|nr:hypothetical protein [Burkholderia thailandensis]MDW9257595.1 hypothetical protein [Burkholderia thailandensis]